MNALTIRQPWASLIFRKLKTREYRQYALPLGRLAIHAGKAPARRSDYEQLGQLVPGGLSLADLIAWVADLPRGCILGTCRVARHETATDRWFRFGKVANILADVEEFDEPIPCLGDRGVWRWEPKILLAEPTLF